jgi:hypothetical protein
MVRRKKKTFRQKISAGLTKAEQFKQRQVTLRSLSRKESIARLKEMRKVQREKAEIRAFKRQVFRERTRVPRKVFRGAKFIGMRGTRVIGGKRRRVKTTPSGRKIRITISEPVDQAELEARRRRERTGIGPNYDLPTFELGKELKQFDTGKGKFGVGRKKKRKRRKQRSKMRRFTF